jgi:hypothetical protein
VNKEYISDIFHLFLATRELARLCQFCKSLGGTKHEHKSTKYLTTEERIHL